MHLKSLGFLILFLPFLQDHPIFEANIEENRNIHFICHSQADPLQIGSGFIVTNWIYNASNDNQYDLSIVWPAAQLACLGTKSLRAQSATAYMYREMSDIKSQPETEIQYSARFKRKTNLGCYIENYHELNQAMKMTRIELLNQFGQSEIDVNVKPEWFSDLHKSIVKFVMSRNTTIVFKQPEGNPFQTWGGGNSGQLKFEKYGDIYGIAQRAGLDTTQVSAWLSQTFRTIQDQKGITYSPPQAAKSTDSTYFSITNMSDRQQEIVLTTECTKVSKGQMAFIVFGVDRSFTAVGGVANIYISE